jgi:hypothetical protein
VLARRQSVWDGGAAGPGEEDAAEVLVRDLLGVVGHRHDFGVPRHARADRLIPGVLDLALRVADRRGNDARHALVSQLDAPEAPTCTHHRRRGSVGCRRCSAACAAPWLGPRDAAAGILAARPWAAGRSAAARTAERRDGKTVFGDRFDLLGLGVLGRLGLVGSRGEVAVRALAAGCQLLEELQTVASAQRLIGASARIYSKQLHG